MADVKWIKLSTDIFDNRKIKLIESMPEGDALVVIWLKLLILAGVINEGGLVYFTKDIPYTEELLSTQFNRPINTIRLALQTFQQFEMIEIVNDLIMVSNWEKYQNVEGMERVREQNRIRKQRQRERERLALEDSHVMSRDSHATDIDIEKEIDIERDKEINIYNTPPISPPNGNSEAEEPDDFDRFWEEYPKKIGKKDARKAFNKAKKEGASAEVMIRAVIAQKDSGQWTRDNGRYIPLPTTWLNQGRWDDEIQPKETFVTRRNGSKISQFATADEYWDSL